PCSDLHGGPPRDGARPATLEQRLGPITGDAEQRLEPDHGRRRAAPRARSRATQSSASSPRTGESEQRLEPDHGRILELSHPAHGEQDPGHEALAIDRIVADGERLADIAEDDLL